MTNIKVGNTVFWQGKPFEVVGFKGERVVLFNPQVHGNRAYVVHRSSVRLKATDVFRIGDRVTSRYWFTGTVTGFEGGTNRVICTSDCEHPVSRVRYAYAPHELELLERR